MAVQQHLFGMPRERMLHGFACPRGLARIGVHARLHERIKTSGFTQILAATPVRCWQGESELVIELAPHLTQHHGFAHGGVIGAAADNACAWAAASVAGDVVTSSYTLHFLGPALGERLRATGFIVTIYGDVLNVLDLKAKFDPASTYQIFGFNPSWSSPNIMGRYFRIGAKLDL